ncbi:MAG: ATPase [Gammaproteobacteria bacterium]|nr:ATPase [Gammaproteobacteria bacterium]|tara:strand:- start:532 stop:2859 length:2328 start_codon:yes stop_codon:yes gene_type:complete
MEPVYLDFHIHTSANPESPNEQYDLDALIRGIESIAEGSPFLISITDHNFVNKSVYLRAARKIDNLLLGVELHVRNYDECRPYHCHIIFNVPDISEDVIDDINAKLDELYPRKRVGNNDNIPHLETIMNCFDGYEFLLLPHGGQNHSTFDKSIPEGVEFDRTLERSIYYNHFDGFTARGNSGLERTHDYFERLGIKEFVNLVTATDNYTPETYPDCKAGREATDFIPTWMLASPTFNGLRLSLSESSRLVYGEKPDSWTEFIESASLHSDNIDIDVTFTPGLNVVIGGSSSGKSLLVDAMYHIISGDIEQSQYFETPYKVEDLIVENPAGQIPHYFNQNYIMKICDLKDRNNTIEDISILKKVFPADTVERQKITNALRSLRAALSRLVQSIEEIELLQKSLSRIPNLATLIVTEAIQDNAIRKLIPREKDIQLTFYSEADYEQHTETLDGIEIFLSKNPLIQHNPNLIVELKQELVEAINASSLEQLVRGIIENEKVKLDDVQIRENQQVISRREEFQNLLDCIKKYLKFHRIFYESLEVISSFSITIPTKPIVSMGHSLSINNAFELTKEKFLEVVNEAFRQGDKIPSFEAIRPEMLFKDRFRKRDPVINTYQDFEAYVNGRFAELNKKTYKIITNDGRDFDQLSAGWKTSVILDLVLGWDSDRAPLIIDQPEDNLATSYINKGLLKAIKECKSKKQIILVSHNATIPMLGDAQNIILCVNENNKIRIASNPLEGEIHGRNVVGLIAEVTDGGKSSIKKRVKKYNLKDFRGES